MFKNIFRHSAILLISLALFACGNAGTGGSNSINNGGTNGGGSGLGSGSGSIDGDGSGSGDSNAAAETIGVRIETVSENGLIERNNISKNNISVVALTHDFKEGHSTSVPSYVTTRSDSNGYRLEFNKLYVEQANLVIKVIVGRDSQNKNIVLYAPLYTTGTNGSITVNIFSHYALKKFFDTLEDEEALDQVLPCSTSTCNNQVLVKANLLAQIHETAQEYDITIPSDQTVAQSVEFLDTQAAFRTNIEAAVAEISREVSPIAKGTRREYSLGSIGRLQYTSQYNGLRFALSLNDVLPEDDQNDIIIGSEISKIVDANELDNNLPIYPNFNQFSSFLDARKELLSSNLPFTRNALSISQSNTYSIDKSSPINFLASLTQNDTSASTEGFLLNARTIAQQIPVDNDLQNIGWQFDPFFSKLYKVNEYERDPDQSLPIDYIDEPNTSVNPTWLVGANYHGGASYNLTPNGNNFIRGKKNEDLNIFSWEVHGQQTDTTFDTNVINDKTYGVINYSLRLNNESLDDTIIELFGETEQWDIASNIVTISQPIANLFYRSHMRSREKDNTVNPLQNNLSRPNSVRDIDTIATLDDSGTANKGIITLDGSLAPIGHSTQDGKHLAFVFEKGIGADGQDRGRGITIATELDSTTQQFSNLDDDGTRYTLLGNTFAINETENSLRNVNNTILTLIGTGGTCSAKLTSASILIKHTVGTESESNQNTLSTPLIESGKEHESSSCSLNGNQIEIDFDAIDDDSDNSVDSDHMFSQALTLKGFITQQDDDSASPGNLISFLWVQGDNLGLVFAARDQELSPTFD